MFSFFAKKKPSDFQLQLRKIHDADHSIPNTVSDDHTIVCKDAAQQIINTISKKLMNAAADVGKKKLAFSDDVVLFLRKDENRIRYYRREDPYEHQFFTNNYKDAEIVLTLLVQELTNMGARNLSFLIGKPDVNSKDKLVHSVAQIMNELHHRAQYPLGMSTLRLRVRGTISY